MNTRVSGAVSDFPVEFLTLETRNNIAICAEDTKLYMRINVTTSQSLLLGVIGYVNFIVDFTL